MTTAVALIWEAEDKSVSARLVKIETDIGHIQSTLAELKNDARSLQGELEKFRTQFYSFKLDVAKEFGSITVEMAKGAKG
jgi:predicted  nucleic acid-binding Zn-ribbon protein